MINRKELFSFLAIVLVVSISLGLFLSFSRLLSILLAIFFVFMINILAKKVTSFYLDSNIEIKIWEIRRYWLWPTNYFKKPVKAGLFFPIFFSLATMGYFVWMASLVFDIKPSVHRAAKRHGVFSYSEVSEDHIGYIATAGVIANLLFAFIGYLIGFSEFARFNIYLALFSLVPISDLDGNKIFFGNITLWSALATITLIVLSYSFLVI